MELCTCMPNGTVYALASPIRSSRVTQMHPSSRRLACDKPALSRRQGQYRNFKKLEEVDSVFLLGPLHKWGHCALRMGSGKSVGNPPLERVQGLPSEHRLNSFRFQTPKIQVPGPDSFLRRPIRKTSLLTSRASLFAGCPCTWP